MEFPKQEAVARLGRTFRELTVPVLSEDVPSEMVQLLARLRELEAQRLRTSPPTPASD
jgi:hypothetical protein